MNNLFCIEQKIGDCWVFGMYIIDSELWEKESHSLHTPSLWPPLVNFFL